MQYKNISDRSRYIVHNSVKQLIPAQGVVNLSLSDIRHAGSAMRYFESVYKAQEIVEDLNRRSMESRGIITPTAAPQPAIKNVVKEKIMTEIAEEVISDIVEDGSVEDESVENIVAEDVGAEDDRGDEPDQDASVEDDSILESQDESDEVTEGF